MYRTISFTLVLLVPLVFSPLFAQISSVTTSPIPALECQNLVVTVNGSMPCANAFVGGSTHTINGNIITVDISIAVPMICLPAIIPYSQPHAVGLVPAGNYTLAVRQFENGNLTSSISFSLTIGSCCSADASFLASKTQLCPGDSISFTPNDTSLVLHTWKLDGSVISTDSITGYAFPTPGNYTISLLGDDGSCLDSTTQTITVGQFPGIAFSQVQNESCPGYVDGSVDVSISNAFGSLTYTWDNGATTEDISNLDSGTYVLTVVDQAGCSSQDSITLGVGTPPVPIFTASDPGPLCPGDNVLLTNTSTNAISYSWELNGQQFATTVDAQPSLSQVGLNTIQLIATNANCSDTASQQIEVSSLPQVSAIVLGPSCPGSQDGSIDVSVVSGILPYSYLWAQGDTTQDRNGLTEGTYVLRVTDSLSCMVMDTFLVETTSTLEASFAPIDGAWYCPGDTLNLQSTSLGATSFAWSDAAGLPLSSSAQLSEILPDSGQFFVQLVVSDNTCTDTVAHSYMISHAPQLTFQSIPEVCPGSGDGSLSVQVNGVSAPYALLWENGTSGSSIDSLTAGLYSLTMTDTVGCVFQDSGRISTQGGVVAAFANYPTDSLMNFEDQSLPVPASWAWSFGDGDSAFVQNPTHAYPVSGAYQVCLSVVDSFGCEDTHCDTISLALSLAPETFLALKMYPNPVLDKLHIELPEVGSASLEIWVWDQRGKLVWMEDRMATHLFTLSVKDLPAGMYHLVIRAADHWYRGRVVKQ
ncbi:MAG: PKD domain-containing protein [Bacteroidota bacterium]